MPDEIKRSEIWQKIKDSIPCHGDKKVISALLKKIGKEINDHDETGNTLLDYVTAAGDIDLAITLAKLGADLNRAPMDVKGNYKVFLAPGKKGEQVLWTPYARFKQQYRQDARLTTLRNLGGHILTGQNNPSDFCIAYYNHFLATAGNLHHHADFFKQRLGIMPNNVGDLANSDPSPMPLRSPEEMIRETDPKQLNAMDHLRLAIIWKELIAAHSPARDAIHSAIVVAKKTRDIARPWLPNSANSLQQSIELLEKDRALFLPIARSAIEHAIKHLKAHKECHPAHHYIDNTALTEFRFNLHAERARLVSIQLEYEPTTILFKEARTHYVKLALLTRLRPRNTKIENNDYHDERWIYEALCSIAEELKSHSLLRSVQAILATLDNMLIPGLSQFDRDKLDEKLYKQSGLLRQYRSTVPETPTNETTKGNAPETPTDETTKGQTSKTSPWGTSSSPALLASSSRPRLSSTSSSSYQPTYLSIPGSSGT